LKEPDGGDDDRARKRKTVEGVVDSHQTRRLITVATRNRRVNRMKILLMVMRREDDRLENSDG